MHTNIGRFTQQSLTPLRNRSSAGGEVNNRYDSVLKGFSAKLQPEHLQSLQGDDLIDYIEPDGVRRDFFSPLRRIGHDVR